MSGAIGNPKRPVIRLPTKPFRGKSKAGAYGDFVTQVDETVGTILSTLDRLKMSKNTLVILISELLAQ